MAQNYAATINPGLEEALVAELRNLGAKKVETFEGGASFRATNKVAYRAVRFLRCANQVRLRVDEFRARDVHELFRKLKRIEWSRLLKEKELVTFRVSTTKSRLNDSRIIIRTASDAMEASRFVVDHDRGIEILLRIDDDRCAVSLDATGRELFKRGYRTEQVAAPIRESLAASILHFAGCDATFLDPCCGSGTLVIEAAMISHGINPRKNHTYPIEKWATFEPDLFAAQLPAEGTKVERFFGSDSDPNAIEISQRNAERAGVAEWTSFVVADIANADPSIRVISNPPYDKRIADKGLTVIEQLDKISDAIYLVPSGTGTNKVLARFRNGGTPVKLVRSRATAKSEDA